MDKIFDIIKRIWNWINDRPINFIIFAAICFAIPYFWKWLLIYLVFPGSFALTYAVYRWFKLRK